MELDGNILKDKARKAMSKLKANLKEFYYHKAEIPSASVQQMAEFIQQHPDTQVSTKSLLGNTYRFFNLKINDDYFYLETNNNRILQLDGFANGKEFVSYRSYRDSNDLHTQIKLT
ncbi:hypothetical protein [Bacillus benzoevorans]|uniref:Chromosome segregation ATPase n=1 Tax=Bacillus benzoevorans TaxID=1456 RepID=A0A7X0HSN1_9BACI|nr:hypothetical protein [Bacillus benzoevorans]MBB6446115.1 chromosome segregation ATPase [Bacillus benzoevorans]